MSADIKPSKTQISKIIQSGGTFCYWLSNLVKIALTNVAISLARDNLPRLVSNLTSNEKNKFDRKISWKRAVRAGKGFTLFISNKDMNDFVKIMKPLQDSGALIDELRKKVKL